MNLVEDLKNDYKVAFKNRDQIAVDTYRFILAEIKTEAINKEEDRENPSKDTVESVLLKLNKKLNESLEIYSKSNKEEAEKIKKELEVITKYLPDNLTDEEIQKLLEETKKENPNLVGMALMGKIMPKLAGRADPNKVKQMLSKS